MIDERTIPLMARPGLPRLPMLDLARGFAALAVVIFHYCYINDNFRNDMGGIASVAVYGYLGVHFFFVLSGFVIFMTLERCHGALDFAFARAARLYPSYLLSIAITLLAVWLLTGELAVGWRDLFANLTMFADAFGAERVNPAYWTLSREVVFYGIIFIALVMGRNRVVIAFIMVWLSLSLFHAIWGLPWLERILILKWTPLFSAGALLYLSVRSIGFFRILFLLVFVSTLPLACYYAVEALDGQRAFFEFWVADERVVVAVIALIYIFMTLVVFRGSTLDWIPRRWIEFIGGGSYILYLIHERVGMILIDTWYISIGAFAVTVTIVLMVGMSLVLYVAFERPMQSRLREIRNRIVWR